MYFRRKTADYFRSNFSSIQTLILRFGYLWVPVLKQQQPVRPFSSPEPTILLVCAKDRDLWQGPKQEVRESRTSGFCAQPQKFLRGSSLHLFIHSAVQLYEFHIFIISSSSFPGILRTNLMTSSKLAC